MSYTIYPAKIEDMEVHSIDGTVTIHKMAVPVLDLEGLEHLKLADNADELAEEGINPFLPNPDYLPGTGLQMSGGNIAEMMRRLGFSKGFDTLESVDIEVLRSRCITEICAGVGDLYMTTRIVQLLNVCDVAIARGADKIAVA